MAHEAFLLGTQRDDWVVRVPPTLDRKKLKASAGGLLTDHGPTPLIDALLEVDDRYMRRAGDYWPVFVIVTGDGSESSVGTDDKALNRWMNTLSVRGMIDVSRLLLSVFGDRPQHPLGDTPTSASRK